MTAITTTTFADWTQAELARCFGLQVCDRLPELEEWLAGAADISDDERRYLEHLRVELRQRGDSWNEEELKLSFIGPLVALVDYNTPHSGFFAGRSLSAVIGEHHLTGIPDGLVAKGVFEPETPYFCLHEYKKEKGRENDPRGQVLAAMLAARELNSSHGDTQPICGAYVLGRTWFFLVLSGQKYAVSADYSAAKDEILDIFRVLKNLKQRVCT